MNTLTLVAHVVNLLAAVVLCVFGVIDIVQGLRSGDRMRNRIGLLLVAAAAILSTLVTK